MEHDSALHDIMSSLPLQVAYDVQNESFWIRSGFMFLYDTQPIGSNEVVRDFKKAKKFTGDDR